MVQLYQNGKPKKEIIREDDLTPSSLDKWVGQSQTSGSFKEKDNVTDEQKELIELRKRNTRSQAIKFHDLIQNLKKAHCILAILLFRALALIRKRFAQYTPSQSQIILE